MTIAYNYKLDHTNYLIIYFWRVNNKFLNHTIPYSPCFGWELSISPVLMRPGECHQQGNGAQLIWRVGDPVGWLSWNCWRVHVIQSMLQRPVWASVSRAQVANKRWLTVDYLIILRSLNCLSLRTYDSCASDAITCGYHMKHKVKTRLRNDNDDYDVWL